uniref:Uncharacterized protein n=1 Tax=Romanomermis culicivorax TaxID=13658 RepID=A0A915JK02_ROMCU
MVLQVNLLNVGNFGRLREWCVLRICHPAVDQTDSGVVGLQQAQWVIQAARFIEEKGQMGVVNGVNDAELLGSQASDPSQYQCPHVMGDGPLLF